MIPGRYEGLDPDGDVDPDDLAFGFHIEEIPEEDEDGFIEHRP